ncbi:hypothetical protein ASPWEDRAFT_39770 [Aspergillus wentii DTO 134E9]|uniref:Uncharacterized protein n=1 Tax=Aspergillus wentii DTO 134E9 TaxID=1073089 RepID=A0A1L9RIE8_ASPWE|nr:uncharacterized protein ASPWEDRAFT_39770 [Aspergillus wentii DTO 134E9]OJJ34694.1 hypothetical protein ASPWEDRAFT_39770 [Aspergillus wentii DTO 134E9]
MFKTVAPACFLGFELQVRLAANHLDSQCFNLASTEYSKTLAMESLNFQPTFLDRLFIGIFHFINRLLPRHKLPAFLGAFNVASMRRELRAQNLHDGPAGV